MGKINILDSSVFIRIAAGEVVENPASIVKELVENSIDAGAKAVTVELCSGGMDWLKVSDDGCGLPRDELKKAFLPHATSKIRTTDDLDCIGTLGFRGEALSSIASVAEVTMTSRTEDSELGAYIKYDNGAFVEENECGCPLGTSVLVRNLFEKIPARRKFLKKPSREEADVSSLMEKLILANPDTAIKYVAEGKTVYLSGGSGAEDAIRTVYGHEGLGEMRRVEAAMPDASVWGYVSVPGKSWHTRARQTLIVNGRHVVSEPLSFAVYNCLREFLMTRRYPVYVLYLTLPLDMVDVNVHPKKLEVKFVRTQSIISLITGAINSGMFGHAPLADEPPPVTQENQQSAPQIDILGSYIKSLGTSISAKGFAERKPFFAEEFATVTPIHDIPLPTTPEPVLQPATVQTVQQTFADSAVKKAGKLFNTYLLLQKDDEVFIVDQHAAHERILYNRLMKNLEAGMDARQDFLMPYIFSVSYADKEVLEENLGQLNGCGFELAALSGLNFSLSAVPLCCSGINPSLFIEEFVRDAKKVKAAEFVRDKIAQAACKAAVKGEQDLSETEIDALIKEMAATEELLCPHGRPVVIRINKKRLEKLFKRIV